MASRMSPSKFFFLFSAYLAVAYAFSSAFVDYRGSSTTVSRMTSVTETTGTEIEEVKVGDSLPSVTLMEGQEILGFDDFSKKPESINLAELIKGKKVAIFGVPGAFTPGCSKSHLPSFIDAQDELKAKGVEMTICVATNDPYVMEAWGRSSGGASAGIRFLSDANAELTRALGLSMESDVFVRSKRFSLIADNGVVTHYFSSAEQSSDTWAPNVLAAL